MNYIEELNAAEFKPSVVVDSKYLFSTLWTCQMDSDRIIRSYFSSIVFVLPTNHVFPMIWFPEKLI